MKLITFYALAAFLLPMKGRAEDSKVALHDALDVQATVPWQPAALPDRASARAKFVQQNIAHGENGEKERAAHAQSSAAGAAARGGTSSRPGQAAAASAAKNADADSDTAAGQARAVQKRNGNVPGSGGNLGNQLPGHGRMH